LISFIYLGFVIGFLHSWSRIKHRKSEKKSRKFENPKKGPRGRKESENNFVSAFALNFGFACDGYGL